MPVTARRTALHRASVSDARSTTPARTVSKVQARHRRPTKPAAPRTAAAMTLSVGLAVGGGALAAQPASAALTPHQRGSLPIAQKPLLRYGDSGSAVKYVQYRLHVPMTSWYGAKTRSAVSNFQRAVHLTRTGTMTRGTWNALAYLKAHPRPTNSTFRSRVLRQAYALRGTPYRYGGTTPAGFDCSGFTGYVYRHSGHYLPRTSRQQYAYVKHISRSTARPGDLIFFKSSSGGVYHVGIYAGGNMLWQASKPGRPTGKGTIWSSNVAFGRV